MDPSVPQAVLEMGLILLLASMVLHKTLGRRNWPLLELILHVERAGMGKACIILVFYVNGKMGAAKEFPKSPTTVQQ